MHGVEALTDLLFGDVAGPPHGGCVTVAGGPGLDFNLSELSRATNSLAVGGCIAYSIRLDLPIPARLVTIAALSYRLRHVRRILGRGHVTVLGSFGVDPHLDAPSVVFQLHSAAADYADRCLRPRGKGPQLRQLVNYVCGVDPTLGGIVLIGRKH